jgi:hypothetical protein
MRNAFSRVHLILVGLLSLSLSCHSNERPAEPKVSVAAPEHVTTLTWSSSDLDEQLKGNKPLYRAWKDFERTQKYRLAQPSDRKLSPDALAQVKLNQNQILPYLTWWGAEGYKGSTDFLIVIVVDPSRSDANRYGLVVIAATGSEGSKYKSYWVAQEEDMESYLVSPASGSVFMECFRRDGTREFKELVWFRSIRQFRLR